MDLHAWRASADARPQWRQLAGAVLMAVLACAVAALVDTWVGETGAALIVLLGVAVAGALHGLVAAVFGATVAFFIYNFFLAEPTLTLTLATKQDLAPLVAFNLAALVTGALAGRLKDRETAARIANMRLRYLLDASRALQGAVTIADIRAAIEGSAPPDLSVVLTLAQGGFMPGDAVPVRIGEQRIGFLSSSADRLPDSREHLTALATLAAIAIERAELADRVAETAALAKSEELKTALLSSVSHDLRTPLAAMMASASSLADYGEVLPAEARRKLLDTIRSEGERLNRFTANLLELSRMQSGSSVPAQLVDPADIVAAAAERTRHRLGSRLSGRVPAGAYLVHVDPQLFEVALVNLLENAAVHAPEGAVEVAACADGPCLELSIADHGPGIPLQDRQRVFGRFQRLDPSRPGSGLGLAIAKGFVEASGGSIEATERSDGLPGTRIVVRLPLARSSVRIDVDD